MHIIDPLTEPPAKDWDAVLTAASNLTDLDALRELWTSEGIASAPNEIHAAFNEHVAAIKAASE
jgi:hypothetical protein